MVKKTLNITGTVTLHRKMAVHDLWLVEPFCRRPAWQDLWLLARDEGQLERTSNPGRSGTEFQSLETTAAFLPVCELLRVAKRRSGGDLPISLSDLLNQMKPRPYWVESKNPSGRRQKSGGKSTRSCWCIRVDLHQLGLMRISDEAFDESFIADAQTNSLFTADVWVDPRKGDLFALIESLKGNQDDRD